MFNGIAPRYDLANHVLSFNIDRLWRKRTVQRVRGVLALLKPEYSQALLMTSSGFTCKEMSGVLGMKTDSLYVLLGRARAKFEQEYLKLYGGQQ